MAMNPEKQSNQFNGRGGTRPGAGRPKGRKSGKTLEIETAARKYAGDALAALVHVATKGKSEGSRVAAAVALLDRGYGRPKQALEHSGELRGGVLVVPSTVGADEWAVVARRQQASAGHGSNGNGNGGPSTNGHG